MGSFKAASPNGMLVATVRNFLVNSSLHLSVNTINTVLIPKGQNPSYTNHFRPIALCNVIYKVITKLLAKRVKPLLTKLICPTQNAFVPGRSIQDNSVLI